MGSLAILLMPGTYPTELKVCGINERGTVRNQLVGCVMTHPSGSQLALEIVFLTLKTTGTMVICILLTSNQRLSQVTTKVGGTRTNYYGEKHWESKDYLRVGTAHIKTS